MRNSDVHPRSGLSLAELIGHAWRVGSPWAAVVALMDAAFRLCGSSWWRDKAPWYAGKVLKSTGWRIRIDGRPIELPDSADDFLRGLVWFGVYEPRERYAVARFLPRALAVVELGGSAGVVACLTNRLLTNPTKHVVVEANPRMVPTLQRNRDRCGCRFTTIHAALAYGGESIEFGVAEDFLASSVGATGDHNRVTIPAVSLAKVVAEARFERCSLVCDIEGAEVELVTREGDLLRRVVEALLIEVHPSIVGVDTVAWLGAEFRRLGFAPVWTCGDVWFLENTGAVQPVDEAPR